MLLHRKSNKNEEKMLNKDNKCRDKLQLSWKYNNKNNKEENNNCKIKEWE